MFENFAKFFGNERNRERIIAVLSVGVGIFLLNKAGLYGETPPPSNEEQKPEQKKKSE
jgi:hypothetical protein